MAVRIAQDSGLGFQVASGAISERVCFACLEILGVERSVVEDGRWFCHTCMPLRLVERTKLLALWDEARSFVVRGLGLSLPAVALVELTPGALAERVGAVWTCTPRRTIGLAEVTPRGATVLIEGGLPLDLVSEVLSHELGHVWFSLRRGHASEPISEGFAQWAAYRFCRQQGLTTQMQRIRNRPGAMAGVRHFLTLEAQQGLQAVLKVGGGP